MAVPASAPKNAAASRPQSAPVHSTAGLALTFDDEFNSLSASASGAGTTWTFDTGSLADNHEAENYLPSAAPGGPFQDAGGVLDITASPVSSAPGLPYTSGGLTTKQSFSQTYGYFEIRAEMPSGAGMWPAFWLLPADGTWPPELDAPEVLGGDPTTIYLSTHSAVQASQTVAVKVANTSQGFHTYGVDWEPAGITYYFDGRAIASLATPPDMNKPMYLVVNLAVGGAGSWPGAATGETGHLLVDYIRAYASASAAPPPLTLSGWGMSVHEGDGSFSVTGAGSGGTVTLGDGNQRVVLTGSAGTVDGSMNTVSVGDGNQVIDTAGNGNAITAGGGVSVIDAGVSYNHVTVGATPAGGVTKLTASGYGDDFTSTGPGDITISGTSGGATIQLGDGDATLHLGGAGNSVTVGDGNAVIDAGVGQDRVQTGAGSSVITVHGFNNILDAGPGRNVLNGGLGDDVFVLNRAGSGVDRITGFNLYRGDVLDFTRALAGLDVSPDAAGLGGFVTADVSAAGTLLSIDPSGNGGSGQAVALLTGVTTSVAELASHMGIRTGTLTI